MSEQQQDLGVVIDITAVEHGTKNKHPVIHVFGRTRLGVPLRIDVSGMEPYFYIPQDEVKDVKSKRLRVDYDIPYTGIRGEDLRRVYARKYNDIEELKVKHHHFESDVSPAVRFLVENDIYSGLTSPNIDAKFWQTKPYDNVNFPVRVCFIDIECTDENGFPKAEKDPIICITAFDSYTNKFTTFLLMNRAGVDINTTYSSNEYLRGLQKEGRHDLSIYLSEKDMLEGLIEYFKAVNPDIITGWNSTEFDLPYIFGRFTALGLETDSLSRLKGYARPDRIRGRVVFDLMEAYKKMVVKGMPSFRLDYIAEVELGEHKTKFRGKIFELWRDRPDVFVQYNVNDVDLCVKIDKKNNIIEFFRSIAKYVGCPMEYTMASSRVIDVYVLRKAKKKQLVLPSRNYGDEGEAFKGATVLEPSSGLREWVSVFDLKSLYPSIMITGNMSFETKDPDGEIRAPNGVRFKKKPDGLTKELLRELMDERDKIKKLRNTFPYGSNEYVMYDLRQNVVKILANTYYGVSGNSRFRLYDRDIGSAVTATGRAIIDFSKHEAESLGNTVIYGDTDSIMVEMNPKPKDLDELITTSKQIEKHLNFSYNRFAKEVMNVDEHAFSTKFEKAYRRFYQSGKKKRYAGHLIWKEGVNADDINITGFETQRSDTPAIAKTVLVELLNMLLSGVEKQKVQAYMSEIIKKYRKGLYPLDEIGIPGGIQKNLDEYERPDAHVRGAMYANQYLGTDFKNGSKPMRIYIKRVDSMKYPKTDVVCFEYPEQIPPEFVIDYDTMMEKTIKDPVVRIIEPLGWSWSHIDPTMTLLSRFGIE